MKSRNSKENRSGWVERTALRAALVLGLAMAVGLGYFTRGAGEGVSYWLTGLVGLSVVGGVNRFGRARARERWRAAWDAYASDELEVGTLDPAEEEPCLAGGR